MKGLRSCQTFIAIFSDRGHFEILKFFHVEHVWEGGRVWHYFVFAKK